MIRKYRNTFTPVCDGCGKELAPEYDFDIAVGAMKQEGWHFLRRKHAVEWYHFCPACKGRIKGDDL